MKRSYLEKLYFKKRTPGSSSSRYVRTKKKYYSKLYQKEHKAYIDKINLKVSPIIKVFGKIYDFYS